MARFQVASDLHVEFLVREFGNWHGMEHVPGTDGLILAGDIGVGELGVHMFAEWPVPVYMVLGNHEAYGGDIDKAIAAARVESVGTAVKVLNRDEVESCGVRILGCTLWTDYRLDGVANELAARETCERVMLDHRAISTEGRRFTTTDAGRRHDMDRAWLKRKLSEPHDGPTIVITHHGVHPRSVHEMFRGDPANPGFHSDLGEIIDAADLWVHGHTHCSVDYRVGKSRVVCNPRGYPRNLRIPGISRADIQWENQSFNGGLVVVV